MTFEHIEKYLAEEILMGIIKLPNIDDYWDKNPLLSNNISEIITENSYYNINSFIHPEAADSKTYNGKFKKIFLSRYIYNNR